MQKFPLKYEDIDLYFDPVKHTYVVNNKIVRSVTGVTSMGVPKPQLINWLVNTPMFEAKSQHKNKTKALSLLSAKLKRNKEESHQAEIASERKILVGTGDRSEKIRTYNFPQGRITDHRIKLTKHNLDQAMDGEIQDICDALIAENQLQMLAQLENE